MKNKNYYSGDVGYGGFLLDNIRNWIIDECFKSGDPRAFFDNVLDVVEDLAIDEDWLTEDE